MDMLQFEITLKNDKIKSYKFIALLLVILNLAVFIFLLIAGVHFYKAFLLYCFSGLYLVYFFYTAKKNGECLFYQRHLLFLFLPEAGWRFKITWLAFACFALGILYHLSLQKIRFIFSDDFIKKMNFPQKTYSWEMPDNVMLKDNILTIDFKNNTLIQGEIESDINEIQFNAFAKQRLFSNTNSIQ